MKILGIDAATVTGWTLYEGMGRGITPRIQCGLWDCRGDSSIEKAAALGYYLGQLIREELPIAYAAVELPLERMARHAKPKKDLAGEDVPETDGSSSHIIAQLNAIAGGAAGVLGAYAIPVRYVAAPTWRKSFTGQSRAPAHIPQKQRKKWMKRLVHDRALKLSVEYGGINIPKSADYDAAESLGIAIWLRAHVQRFQAEDAIRHQQAA